jgi:hypothetical protein
MSVKKKSLVGWMDSIDLYKCAREVYHNTIWNRNYKSRSMKGCMIKVRITIEELDVK